MSAALLLGLCFAICFWAGRRSLVSGICGVIGIGYFYGIIRANYEGMASYFLFDAGVLGFYLAQFPLIIRSHPGALKIWFLLLIAWPAFMFFLPFQDILIQLVGLRGNIFLLPFLLTGALLNRQDLFKLTIWLAGLNIVAFFFAVAEYFLGVTRFFPYSPATEIIYRSHDITEFMAYRIPATFGNAHAYAGTMVVSLPFLVGAWVQDHSNRLMNYLVVPAIAVSILGVFMSAARIHFLIAFLLAIVTTFSIGFRYSRLVGWIVLLAGIGWIVSSEERFQRFTTLRNTDYVVSRIAGSINMTFFDLAYHYPLGSGLGGGGTSIPYFLQDRVRRPIHMENEYARVLLEQGVIGLYLWLAFILWLFTRRTIVSSEAWFLGRRLAWYACAAYFASGLLGIGLFTSIPQTCLLLLLAGWIALPQAQEDNLEQPFLEKSALRSA